MSLILENTAPLAPSLWAQQKLESLEQSHAEQSNPPRPDRICVPRQSLASPYDEQLHVLSTEYEHSAILDKEALNTLYQAISDFLLRTKDNSSDNTRVYRNSPESFISRSNLKDPREQVFSTVSPFLIEQRLEELLDWTRDALKDQVHHPLFIIGTFHVLFLQIHPYHFLNHFLSLHLLWRLLTSQDYEFVRFSGLAPVFSQNSRAYFSALRQAEKTAYGNWSTLNIWLEFFLESLISATNQLLKTSEQCVQNGRLSKVQKRIIEVVQTRGSVTRDAISRDTGINLSTIKYNLSVLAAKGYLKREGAGRTTGYRLV